MDNENQNNKPAETQVNTPAESPTQPVAAVPEPATAAPPPTPLQPVNKRRNFIILACVLLFVALLVWVFMVKPIYVLGGASRGSALGLESPAYTQVDKHCPADVELETNCLRYFYTQNSVSTVQKTVTDSLKSDGYVIKSIKGGYDGPNQTAMVAYSAKKNVSLVVIILDTNNEAYKKANGNVRVEATYGNGKYNKYNQ